MSKSSEKETNSWFYKLSDESKLNLTDPKVVHDPTLEKPIDAKVYEDGNENKHPNTGVASNQYYGSKIPIINFNGISLGINNIQDMILSFNKFTPSLKLTVKDNYNKLKFIGGVGLNNRISVIITPPNNGLYRKISLPFYIKEQNIIDEYTTEYICDYYHNGLWKTACEQIGDGPLTTYEFIETISKQLQLGFAATNQCKEITDKRYRQIYSQRISEFIKKQIEIGGTDETSIFDCWIDGYGYINLINLAWVFNENVKSEDLSMKYISGDKNTPIETEKRPESEPKMIKRFITNDPSIPIVENKLKTYYNDICTEYTNSNGVLKICWLLKNPGDSNNLEMQTVQMIEESLTGIRGSGAYESYTTEFIGIEMSEDTPYLMQREIRKSFMIKRRSRQLILIMENMNFAFQRGILVSLMIMESEPDKIRKLQANTANLYAENPAKDINATSDNYEQNLENNIEAASQQIPSDNTVLTNNGATAINLALSGIYYIDGIEYKYDSDAQFMRQHIYLIKHGVQSNLFNGMTIPIIS